VDIVTSFDPALAGGYTNANRTIEKCLNAHCGSSKLVWLKKVEIARQNMNALIMDLVKYLGRG
jgi:hypothetical protein